MTNSFDPASEGAQMQFDGRMSYTDYLRLDSILSAQSPISDAPDEMLFIIQHQTSELWLKLALLELHAARAAINADELPKANKMIARIARIFEQLNNAWDVLRTMTPSDYTTFRETLGQSSGFQSYQYRMVEFVLGNRNAAMIKPHAHRDDLRVALEQEMALPSLYDAVLGLAIRRGHKLPDLARDLTKPHTERPEIVEMWRKIYADTAQNWALYELAEKLVDLEDYFRRWRFNHVTTVERVIGFKRGTGGTSGVDYLKRMLAVELFPDLWRVRTVL